MQFFVDTADLDDIAELNALGLVDGVTTNPSLIKKAGRDFKDVIAEICAVVSGPVSAEVIAVDVDGMLQQGRTLAAIAPNVVVKLPLTLAGLQAVFRRRNPDQCHALLFGKPGTARRQGRGHLYLAVHRTPRRYPYRRTGTHPRDPDHL